MKTKEDSLKQQEKKRVAERGTGQVSCHDKVHGRQPKFYSHRPDQPDALCTWKECHSPCYKSLYCLNEFEATIEIGRLSLAKSSMMHILHY